MSLINATSSAHFNLSKVRVGSLLGFGRFLSKKHVYQGNCILEIVLSLQYDQMFPTLDSSKIFKGLETCDIAG